MSFDSAFDPVNVLWGAIGAILVVFVVARGWSRYLGPKDSSLGSVSDRWLAEQRLHRPDSQR